jgi:hypothetical protein
MKPPSASSSPDTDRFRPLAGLVLKKRHLCNFLINNGVFCKNSNPFLSRYMRLPNIIIPYFIRLLQKSKSKKSQKPNSQNAISIKYIFQMRLHNFLTIHYFLLRLNI